MKKFKRVFAIIIDSVGAGEAPLSHRYGDKDVNTLAHTAETAGGLNVPNMERLGLGKITSIKGVKNIPNPLGSYGKMDELSDGKDTMTGHWELMGLEVKTPFLTFTETGFPKELIDEFTKRTGHEILGNKSASGTEILVELGEEHMRTKKLIVYTSADSVLQIAAHEDIIPLEELYRVCEIAREITLRPEWMVGRIIARPFVGEDKNSFKRTSNRHDYALQPFAKTTLDELKEANYDVIGIGKINDIYDGAGITEYYKNKSNYHGMEQMIAFAEKDFHGLCYLNLVDFDALYGHRRDPIGYAKCLEEFDVQLGELLEKLTEDDLVLITADHGNDPTAPGTDHTREYVPLLAYSIGGAANDLGVRKSFADFGATIADNFGVKLPDIGTSFLGKLRD